MLPGRVDRTCHGIMLIAVGDEHARFHYFAAHSCLCSMRLTERGLAAPAPEVCHVPLSNQPPAPCPCRGHGRLRADPGRRRHGPAEAAAECLLRPHPRALPQPQCRLLQAMAGRTRHADPGGNLARRFGQAGARGDRWPGGRRGDPGPGLRHRLHRREGQVAAHRLAEASARQQHALHLDHRIPGAQGQPEADQGLAGPAQVRCAGDHAQSEDFRRRALELPGRLGLWPVHLQGR